jgi:cytoskeleton protein RodZ
VVAAVYVVLLDDESGDNARHVSVVSSEPENSSRQLDADSAGAAGIESAVESSSVHEAPAVTTAPALVDVTKADSSKDAGPAESEAEQGGSEAEVFIQSELVLVFNDDSWVEVTDARGERLIYRLAKAGMSHAVTGVAPFDVQLGYVPGVEVFYDGAPYDLSRYAGRRSARFRVGTAGGYRANQKVD